MSRPYNFTSATPGSLAGSPPMMPFTNPVPGGALQSSARPGGLITHSAGFLSEEWVMSALKVRPWIKTTYDERLMPMQPIFHLRDLSRDALAAHQSGTHRQDEAVLSLPQLNEVLRNHWITFRKLRAALVHCDPNTWVPLRTNEGELQDKDGDTTDPEITAALRHINQDSMKKLLDTPASLWKTDHETAKILESHALGWLDFVTMNGIRSHVDFLGVMRNQVGADMTPAQKAQPHLRGKKIINLQADGPTECFNMWGPVPAGAPLRFVLTRRFDDKTGAYHEPVVIPWAGHVRKGTTLNDFAHGVISPFATNPALRRTSYIHHSKDQQWKSDITDAHMLQIPDATEHHRARGSWWEVGKMLDHLGSPIPSIDRRRMMVGIPEQGKDGLDIEPVAYEQAATSRARIKILLNGSTGSMWVR